MHENMIGRKKFDLLALADDGHDDDDADEKAEHHEEAEQGRKNTDDSDDDGDDDDDDDGDGHREGEGGRTVAVDEISNVSDCSTGDPVTFLPVKGAI